MTLHVRPPVPRRGVGAPGLAVELAGLPGSGKSRLAREVVRAVRERDAPARVVDAPVGADARRTARLTRKAVRSGSELLRHPRRSAHVVAGVASSQPQGRDALSLGVQWLVTQRLLAAARSAPGLHLFEEGVLQTLWSIGMRGSVDRVLAVLDGQLSWPDLVVVVDAPLPVVQDRLSRRVSRHSRVQHLATGQQGEALRQGHERLGELLAWWQGPSGPGVPVVVLTNDDAPPDPRQVGGLADRLVSALRQQPAPSRRAPRGRSGRSRHASPPG